MKIRARVWLPVATIVAVLLSSCSDDAAPEGEQGAQEMEGMPGMEGMAGMEGMGREGGSIRLTPEQIGTFGVTFGFAEVRPLSRDIRAVGVVEMDETRVAHVSPRFAGWAERLHVGFTGEAVRAGQPVVEVYAPEWDPLESTCRHASLSIL